MLINLNSILTYKCERSQSTTFLRIKGAYLVKPFLESEVCPKTKCSRIFPFDAKQLEKYLILC